MYSIAGYGQMIADELRMTAYANALRHVVRPGSVVLDIGAGTGIFSLLACQLGARKVYAVEPSPAISVLREAAQANGYADRVTCIQNLSTEIDLPEKTDVIVSDVRDILPPHRGSVRTIIDARQRFLAAGGHLIPQSDSLWAAVVENASYYDGLVKPWARFQFDMSAATKIVTNQWRKAPVAADQLLSEPACWASLNYLTVDSPNVAGAITVRITRSGTGHGLAVWFDTILEEGIGFTNAPGKPELIYGRAFFPWENAVALTAGDTVSMSLRADLVGAEYVWSWESEIFDGDSSRCRARFRQSTFLAESVSAAQLGRWRGGHRPKVHENGRIDLELLQLMDGSRRNDEIARIAVERFPERFRDERQALTRIAQLTELFSE
jgi:protein arginine N-methyltransferase 1